MPVPTRRRPRAVQDDEEDQDEQEKTQTRSSHLGRNADQEDHVATIAELSDAQPLVGEQSTMIRQMAATYEVHKEFVEQAFKLLSSSAEEVAEFDALIEENERIDGMDQGVRTLVDLESETAARRKALETIRDRLDAKDQILDAPERYKCSFQSDVEAYQTKTARQKYASHQKYLDFREGICTASSNSAMLHINDLIPAEVGDEDNSDDDLAFAGERQSFRCPLTGTLLMNPVISTTCNHSYTKEAVFEYLQGGARKDCPASGCRASIARATLKDDNALAKKVATHRRREEERESLRRQTSNAVVLE